MALLGLYQDRMLPCPEVRAESIFVLRFLEDDAAPISSLGATP